MSDPIVIELIQSGTDLLETAIAGAFTIACVRIRRSTRHRLRSKSKSKSKR